MPSRWKTYLPVALGAAVLAVPTVYILNESNTLFAEQCRQKCDAAGMDYKVKAVGVRPAADLQYPGECLCVARGERQWWQFWK